MLYVHHLKYTEMTSLVLSFQLMYACYLLLLRPPESQLHVWQLGAN